MNETRLNRTLLNRSVLNTTRLNATGIARKAKESVEDRVMKSLVLWYDLKKQGATNESMEADPRIIDHSGNGHHATCYNFAWSGMSGVGGYGLSFSQYNNIKQDRAVIEFEGDYITIIKSVVLATWQIYNKVSNQLTVSAQRIKVSNVPQNASITYAYRDINTSTIVLASITNDGIYDIPSFTVPSGQIYGLEIQSVIDACNITIEQLPLYPHALVSDGVDDYVSVGGLPIFTKERGYTVIADRTLDSARFNNSTFATKRTSVSAENGAFQFERGSSSVVNFGQANVVKFTLSGISCLTSKEYNGKPIRIGDKEDSDYLTFCRLTPSSGDYGFMAMRSFLLFDRDLTAEEIEWVKSNMIGGEQ